MIFGIYSRCTPLQLGTQVSDIEPSWFSCFKLISNDWRLFDNVRKRLGLISKHAALFAFQRCQDIPSCEN